MRKKLPNYIKGDTNVKVEKISWFTSEKIYKELNEWSKTIFAIIGLYIVLKEIRSYIFEIWFHL